MRILLRSNKSFIFLVNLDQGRVNKAVLRFYCRGLNLLGKRGVNTVRGVNQCPFSVCVTNLTLRVLSFICLRLVEEFVVQTVDVVQWVSSTLGLLEGLFRALSTTALNHP